MRRLVGCLLVLGLLAAVPAAEASPLSIRQARSAAYKLTYKVGLKEGASYAFAGYCRRRSALRVNCWGALVYDDNSAAAQRITVVKGTRIRAARFGRVYTGTLTDSGGSRGGTSNEWAVCTSGGFCVGS